MAGLDAQTPAPTHITLHGQSRALEIGFATGEVFRLPFELLRVYSPSAQVQGHGPGQSVLQTGKRLVDIVGIEPVGHYAIQPRFSDGHDSGIYTWAYLYEMGQQQAAWWADYEARLAAAGASRDAPQMPYQAESPSPAGGGCGSAGGCGCGR
ncbi:DUF971 domain-containing protein [Allofranklinella schreckenbergeri]|uniref:DUF971 domain-containing protein n=1 Tax=Allofranklinella schreckenbergeri TaxID=1076744 RepID=A0A3M6QWY2_9BURK|nr:DUF971 domain-containing protein [Allofranklinella schreckenbergeri]RMX07517.1 DUF971 domain-containing protein [Allofranklinella schreckenbergeri]